MARAPDVSSADQFNVTRYTESWAANNPYYAPHVNWAFDTQDTTRGRAAAYSGVVATAGYNNVTPQNQGINQNDPHNWANPTNRNTAYDRFGNVQKQRGDTQLGLVLMGGFQFPGQAFSPARTSLGTYRPNKLGTWMNKQGTGGYSPEMRRGRTYKRELGYSPHLTQSEGSNKAPGGVGQSSEDSTQEMYSTQETRLGTRAYFTDEEFNEGTGKFGRSWAGFRPLGNHNPNPHFDSKLGQMFKTENPNVGAARRVIKSRL